MRIEDAVEQLAEIADESMIPPPPPEEELPELEPQEVQSAPVEEFPVERVTDDEIPIDDGGAEEKRNQNVAAPESRLSRERN